MSNLTNLTCKAFTEVLASPSPVPGGGGAGALVGAIGIALGDMVGEFTVGKKKYADVETEIKELMISAQELRNKFLTLVDADADAFEPLSKAYGIPKDDPNRDAVLENCLKTAASVPMQIFDLSAKGIDLLKTFADKGSRMVVSDAACGASLCLSAMMCAAVNVKVNTKLMKDRNYADKCNEHIDNLMPNYKKTAELIFDSVYKTFDV